MKCIKKNDVITKVSDEEAHVKVNKHGWKYVPKSEWKTSVRDAVKIVKEAIKVEKDQTTKERKAKNRSKAYAEKQER